MLARVTITDAQLSIAWVNALDINAETQYPSKFYVSTDGNVVIAGHDYKAGHYDNVLVTKINPSGVTEWSQTIFDTVGGEIQTLILDPNEDVYLSGFPFFELPGFQPFIGKLDSSGVFLWRDSTQTATDCQLDHEGRLICLIPFQDIELTTYDSNGIQLWDSTWGSSLDSVLINAEILRLDQFQNLYVSGEYTSWNPIGDYEYFVHKYSNIGQLLWEYKYDPSSNNDYVHEVSIDDVGSVYLLGNINQSTDGIVLLKVDSNGNFQWDRQIVEEETSAHDLNLDSDGNVLICGKYIIGNTRTYFVSKYSPAGDLLWTNMIDTAYFGNSISGVISDNFDNVYFTASVTDPITASAEIYLAKYDPFGNILFEDQFNALQNIYDVPLGIELDEANSIYIVAKGYDSINFDLDILAIKISQTTGVPAYENTIAGLSVSSNPFNQLAFITLPVMNGSSILEWYDLQGKEIRTEEVKPSAVHTIYRGNLPQGMYFLRLVSNEAITLTAKIIIQ